jgi:hypothetical protein
VFSGVTANVAALSPDTTRRVRGFSIPSICVTSIGDPGGLV